MLLLNFYRRPNTPEVLEYLCGLEPRGRFVIGGDANAYDPLWEPSLQTARNGGERLADWSRDSGMLYTGEPGVPTHDMGHTIDLVFSNIPFVETVIDKALWSSSDHMTLITTIPTSDDAPPSIPKWKIEDDNIQMFNDLVGNSVDQLSNLGDIGDGDTLALD